MPQTVRRTNSQEWVFQLDRMSRHAMSQARFVEVFQGMTACTDQERDEELERLLRKARLVIVTYMCSFEAAGNIGTSWRED